jgi:hypothetical protein
LWKSPPTSASAADDMIFLRILLVMWMAPLMGGAGLVGSGLSSPFRKKKPPTHDLASVSDR